MSSFVREILFGYWQPNLYYILFLGFIIFSYIAAELYYSKFRGFMGEFWISRELKKLPDKDYKVYQNFMFQDQYGTHQIDFIVFSIYGIFVIEMKNYYGFITGKEYDLYWTQHFRKGKYKFYNPIRQNYGHIKSLSALLQIPESYFISIICFSNQVKLSVKGKTIITQTDLLNKVILEQKEKNFPNDLQELYDFCKKINIKKRNVRKEHINQIQKRQFIQKQLALQNICPKCGSKLVVKEGRYGKFMGCPNYPKCKFTKEYKKEE